MQSRSLSAPLPFPMGFSNGAAGKRRLIGDGSQVELDQGAVLFGDLYNVAIGKIVSPTSINGFLGLIPLVDFEDQVVLAVAIFADR